MSSPVRRVAFSTGALYPRDSAEALKLLAQAGFEYAELMPQCRADTQPDFARKVKGVIKVAAVHYPLVFFPVLYNPHPGMIAESRTLSRDLVASAAILGTEVIIIHAGNPVSEAERKAGLEEPVLDNLRDLATLAQAEGIRIALEHNPKTAAGVPEELLAYNAKLDHPGITPMVDVTESFEADIDPVVFINKVKPCHTHLSDHKGNVKHIPAGEGDADWPGIRKALESQGYAGLWCLEPMWRFYLGEALPALVKAKAFMEGL